MMNPPGPERAIPWSALLACALCVLLILALAGCAEPPKVREVAPFSAGVNAGFWTGIFFIVVGIIALIAGG